MPCRDAELQNFRAARAETLPNDKNIRLARRVKMKCLNDFRPKGENFFWSLFSPEGRKFFLRFSRNEKNTLVGAHSPVVKTSLKLKGKLRSHAEVIGV